MGLEEHSRSIKLICSTCASDDFEYENEEGPFRCVSCSRILTRDELISESGHIIEDEVNEMGAEVLKDAQKELSAAFRKAFSGSKHIKFK